MSLLALQKAKERHQAAMERYHPCTLRIASTNYACAGLTKTGDFMTIEGGTKQVRSMVFSVRQSVLPLIVVRDTAEADQPLRRLAVTHVETGIVYRLDGEWTDVHGTMRELTCVQQHD